MSNINLTKFRAPGVYSLEIDNTTREESFQSLVEDRILIGFSRKGPFNTVTRIETVDQRREIYGDVDTFLEKRGSFFHRSIDIALQSGPVLALNILPLDNSDIDGDKVPFRSFSTSPYSINSPTIDNLLSSFYDKEKLWKVSQDNFRSIVDSNLVTANSILSLVNLGQNKMSIIIKKSNRQSGFDITAKEYYGGSENVPLYLDPDDTMSEYFVDVYAIKGDFSDYQSLSTDPIYSRYFDSSGLIGTAIDSILTSEDFNIILSVTGSLIPDLVDGSGISYSIDTVVNSYTTKTGLFSTINDDYLNSIESLDNSVFDMVGHSFADPDNNITEIDFLSYRTKIIENLEYSEKTSFDETLYNLADVSDPFQNTNTRQGSGLFSNRITVDGINIQENIVPGYSLIGLTGDKYATIKNYNTSSGNTVISYSHPDKTSEGSFGFMYLSSNVSANTVVIEGVHDDFSYAMVNESVYATDGKSRYYFDIDSYTTDPNTNSTSIVFKSGDNIDELNGNFKVSWSAGYKVIGVDTANTSVTVKGKWNFDDIASSLTGNVVYLKTASTRTGEMVMTDFSYTDEGDTEISISSANVAMSNGSVVDIVSTSDMDELITSSWYMSIGGLGITRPKLDSGNVSVVHVPDIIKTDGDFIEAYEGSLIYSDWKSGDLTTGDVYYDEVIENSVTTINNYYIAINQDIDQDGIATIRMSLYNDDTFTQLSDHSLGFGNKKLVGDDYQDVPSNVVSISSKKGSLNTKVPVTTSYDNGTRVRIPLESDNMVSVGDYISTVRNVDGERIYFLSPVLTKRQVTVGTDIFYDITLPRPVNLIRESGNFYLEKFTGVDDFIGSYDITYLSGFDMKAKHLPGTNLTKQQQLEKILGYIEDIGMDSALADRNLIDYRYIIDTFESTVENQTQPKDVLSRLAMKQGRSMALLNGPSVKAFTSSAPPNPMFTTFEAGNATRIFKPEFIATGGNPATSPDYKYSFPNETNGSKYSMFFGPHLKYRTPQNRTISIPPSAHVSNLFVNRINIGESFKIAAGTNRGFIADPGVIGVEYEFTTEDTGYLEQIGYNPIINKRGYGILLYGNNTAYQRRISALNKGHVRDNINTISREIDNILEKYLFDQNNSRTRFLVKQDMETYLFNLLGNVIEFYSVTIDEKNNTPDTIASSLGIVDVSISPIMGLEKFVNILTINSDSGVSTSGFNIG